MNNRTKQQNEIMTNITIDFAVEGMPTLTKFVSELQELVSSYGQQLRIVGFTTRKPTARPQIFFKLGTESETNLNDLVAEAENDEDEVVPDLSSEVNTDD